MFGHLLSRDVADIDVEYFILISIILSAGRNESHIDQRNESHIDQRLGKPFIFHFEKDWNQMKEKESQDDIHWNSYDKHEWTRL